MVENPILRDKISYSFEPSGNDKVTSLSKEHDAELYLNKVSQSVVRWVGGVKCNWWAEPNLIGGRSQLKILVFSGSKEVCAASDETTSEDCREEQSHQRTPVGHQGLPCGEWAGQASPR